MTSIDGNPIKYLSVNNDLMLIKHGNGLFIDNYSLTTMEYKSMKIIWKCVDTHSSGRGRLLADDAYPSIDSLYLPFHVFSPSLFYIYIYVCV